LLNIKLTRQVHSHLLFFAGKGYHKLREGTHQKVMEFVSKLYDMVCDISGSPAPAFSELSRSQQSITSRTANDIEETEILTPP
jgi:hypothetical protein